MKNYITLCVVAFVLVSCGTSQSEIETAKQELLWNSQSNQISQDTPKEQEVTIEDVNQDSLVQIIELDANSPISFDAISEESLSSWEVVITGAARQSVEMIEVFFTNPTSKYPDDRYTLQAFSSGDSTFKYIASSNNQVLDFGQNEYIFRASSEGETFDTKIILEVPSVDQVENTGTESNLIGTEENFIFVDLPTSSKYGEPMRLWEESFTYTQIKWFEIEKEILDSVTCETLTPYLTERINSWYYWNTCRDIVKDKWIKFNVIRLSGEEYVYERHYIDFIHGFYGVYELETWVWVTSENIAEKNTELKEREFPSLEVVDDLMKDIVNS